MRKFVSFRTKLMVFTTLIVIIAVVLVAGCCIYTHFKYAKGLLVDNAIDVAEVTKNYISTEFEKFSAVLGNQSTIGQIYGLGNSYAQTDRNLYKSSIQQIIQNMYFSVTGIYGLGFIDEKTGTVFCAGNASINQTAGLDARVYTMDNYDTGREIWFFKQDKQKQIVIYKYLYYVEDSFRKKPVGRIFMIINEENFYNKIFNEQRELYGSIIMTDADDVIVCGTTRDLIGQKFSEVFSNKKSNVYDKSNKYTIIDGYIDISNWHFKYLISENAIYANIFTTVKVIIVLLICCMISTFILVYIFSGKISRPLVVLNKYMNRMADGIYDELPAHKDNDEIGMVYSCYNNMVLKLNEQINHNLAMQLQVKDARIKAYEMQINPHFIYNTLQLIQMLSIMHKNESVEEAAVCLGSILRFNLKGDKEVMVRDEVENINNYFKILSLRYGDSIEYHVDIDEHIMDKYILKFLFQPLVENSLKHGIELVQRKGEITIYAKEIDDEIVFIVKDNGLGLKPEELKHLNESINNDQDSDSIGLRNVNQRIKLFYGNKFGLEVFSVYDKKTEIFIHMPSRNGKLQESDE